MLVYTAIAVIPAAALWGVVYVIAGEVTASYVPFSYLPLTTLNLVFLRMSRSYRVFEVIQLTLIVVLPALLLIALGGFVSGSAVVFWSVLAPVGAVVYSSRRSAWFWSVMFVVLVAITAVVDPMISRENSVPEWARTILFAGNLLGPSSIGIAILAYFVSQNDIAYGLLNFERDRSEKLLQNMLPEQIAARLKDGTENVADRFEAVSVLFADMVGSTVLASKLSPEDMVGLLNEIFTGFDEITLNHGVEKISTSGDNYVVAAGVPEVRADHAVVLVRVALEMCDFLSRHAATLHTAGRDLKMRFGINTGPAVAGVVGQRNFHYDIWGDAVNTASRMESTGEPGRIQVSEATYELIKYEFECEERGEVEVKGKGVIRTWWVVG